MFQAEHVGELVGQRAAHLHRSAFAAHGSTEEV